MRRHWIMLDHPGFGISRDQTCNRGLEWDTCAPGLLCGVASNVAGHSAKIFPPKSLTHSNDAEMEFQSRRAYPRKTRKNGAPRPMKMGTIVSPWRYDASAYVTMRHVKLRRHTISSCERPQRKRSRMPRPRQVPAIPADKLGIESSFPVAPSSEAR
jgi:hypothetical protein